MIANALHLNIEMVKTKIDNIELLTIVVVTPRMNQKKIYD